MAAIRRARVELDVGVKQHRDDGKSCDTKSGPSAAIRNVASVFRGEEYEGRRLLITDRFYTSVPMVQQLRTMGFNFVGTMNKRRLGWCKEVEYKIKTRTKEIPRGIFKMATAKSDPGLTALGWMDNRPVYFLASQVSRKMTTIQRREKTGEVTIVPCPELVVEYQTYMGGVDKHDQLRLQSYSMQLSTRFQKYYKSLYLGLVDMVLVNCFITRNLILKKRRQPALQHHSFFTSMQAVLIAMAQEDFTTDRRRIQAPARSVGVVASTAHITTQANDYRVSGTTPDSIKQKRQRACKVCSILKVRYSHMCKYRSEFDNKEVDDVCSQETKGNLSRRPLFVRRAPLTRAERFGFATKYETIRICRAFHAFKSGMVSGETEILRPRQ